MTTKAVRATVSSFPTKPPWSVQGEKPSARRGGARRAPSGSPGPRPRPHLHAPVDNGTGVPEGAVGLLLGQQPLGRLLQLFRGVGHLFLGQTQYLQHKGCEPRGGSDSWGGPVPRGNTGHSPDARLVTLQPPASARTQKHSPRLTRCCCPDLATPHRSRPPSGTAGSACTLGEERRLLFVPEAMLPIPVGYPLPPPAAWGARRP